MFFRYFKFTSTSSRRWLPAILLLTLILSLAPARPFLIHAANLSSEIQDLDSQIKAQQKKLDDLQVQKETYQKEVEQKRKEIVSLKNQMSILDSTLQETELDIEVNRIATTKTLLEIKNTEALISQTEKEISKQQERLGEILRLLYASDQRSLIEILLLSDSLVQYFDQIKYTEDLQKNLQDTLDQVHAIKNKLDQQKGELDLKKADLDQLRQDLEAKQEKLNQQKIAKSVLLTQTRGSEQKFQSLLSQIQSQWQAANNDIANLESAYRAKLAQQKNTSGKLWTGGTLGWPVPSHFVTCEFHDPDYPFRSSIGEHSGTDMRAPQGTPISAPAAGYVAQAKNNGMGYSYIIIVHNNNISTVYGHVSKIYVKIDDYVIAGQIIGATGGAPGTPGAGSFSTAPHLHFEVRLNGLPVNPLDYLR